MLSNPMRALAAIVTLALAVPAVASGAGGSPGVGPNGGGGAPWQGGGSRFVTFPAPGGGTLVAMVRAGDGTVARFATVAGRYRVPLVAYDGSAETLPPESGTLVLARPTRSPVPLRSDFVILSTGALGVVGHVHLGGSFSFDALSPDGRILYLVQRFRHGDVNRYRVRAYDVPGHRLLPQVIADRRTGERQMTGLPITRLQTADGGWAYTLYQDPNGGVFVHALDTRTMTAHCIDLPGVSGGGDPSSWRLALAAGGTRLRVSAGSAALATIDLRTFRGKPVSPPPVGLVPAPAGGSRADTYAVVVAIAAAAAIAAGIARFLLRRRRPPAQA